MAPPALKSLAIIHIASLLKDTNPGRTLRFDEICFCTIACRDPLLKEMVTYPKIVSVTFPEIATLSCVCVTFVPKLTCRLPSVTRIVLEGTVQGNSRIPAFDWGRSSLGAASEIPLFPSGTCVFGRHAPRLPLPSLLGTKCQLILMVTFKRGGKEASAGCSLFPVAVSPLTAGAEQID